MSLKVWLPLDGDLHNQGCTDVTIINNGTTVNTSGKIGSCYYFNASSYLYENTYNWTNFNTSQFSLCCWYKQPSPVASGNSQIICIGISSGWNNIRIGLLRRASNGYPMFSVSDGSSAVSYNCTATTFSLDTWNHIACTYDNGTMKIYLNGTLNKTYTTTIAPVLNSSQHLGIGAASNGAEKLTGYLNDVRVYDHALSAAEVKEISQGLVLHYKLDGFFGGAGENLVINGDARNGLTGWSNWGTASSRQVITINNKKWFTFKTDANGNYGGFSQDRGIALYKPNTQYTISALMYASANASGRLWVHTRSTEGGANLAQYLTTVNVTTSPALYTFTFNTGTNASYTINKLNLMIGAVNTTSALDFYISDIKVEEGIKATSWVPSKEESGYDITKIEDSSGYSYHGTIIGNPTISTDTIRYSSCTNFPENADGILSTFPLSLWNNAFTYSFWIKPSGENGGRSIYAASYNGTSCSIEKTAGNKLRFYWGGSPDLVTSSLTITDGVWQHIAIVKSEDKTKIYCYYNGELKDTFTNTFSDKTFSGNLRIARDTRGDTTSYTGLMSDFRIYCTPLLDTDIKQLYNVGMKVDKLGNVHTSEFVEKSDGSEAQTDNQSVSLATYSTSTTTESKHFSSATVSMSRTTRTYTTQIPLLNVSEFQLNWPTFTYTTRTGSYYLTTGTQPGSRYYKHGEWRIRLLVYDANNELQTTINIVSGSRSSAGSTSALASETVTVSNLSKQIQIEQNVNYIYGKLEFSYIASAVTCNGTATCSTYVPPTIVTPQLIKTSQFYNRIINEINFNDSHTQILKDGMILSRNFIEK